MESNQPYTFEEMVEQYNPLIRKVTRQIYNVNKSNPMVDYDDLYQEALLGLLRAMDLFDPERGTYFNIYLRKAIEYRLMTYCRDTAPHFYKKDLEKSTPGKSVFKYHRVPVYGFQEADEYEENEQ